MTAKIWTSCAKGSEAAFTTDGGNYGRGDDYQPREKYAALRAAAEELADMEAYDRASTGCKSPTLSRAGRATPCKTLRKLADALGVVVDDLV